MKKSILILTIALPMTMQAQTAIPGAYRTYAANEGSENLTMSDVILNRNVRPAAISASWKDAQTIRFNDNGWKTADAATGEISEYKTVELPPAIPKSAKNITESPAGNAYAFTEGRSLYLCDGSSVKAVAESSDAQISFGTSVSRDEFGITNGIFWSPKGSRIAFYRKDESRVTEFPLLDISTRTGDLMSIKYPMNGMESEEISLGIFNLASGSVIYCKVDDFGYDRYLTNISWTPDEKYVLIQVLDRTQKHMKLNQYRADDGSFVRTVLEEHNERYVEPLDPVRFIEGTYSFIYRTDNRDGFRNLYLCDTLGTVRRLTCVDADVEYLGNDGKSVFYTSAEVSPVENHLFRIDIKADSKGSVAKAKIGKPVRLTVEEGWHDIALSPDCSRYIDTFSSFTVPTVTNLCASDGKLIRNLSTSGNPLSSYRTGEAVLGTVKSADGNFDNWYRLFLPADFDPSKKYPVILYVYGGPHSQMVRNSWMGNVRMWEMLMAEKGYIVYVQDNRGTSNRGAAYEKAIHRRCGQAEMEDQMVGISMLKSLPFVDSERIGVHGWSYGGFMTISLMTNYPETFKVGVAGGPVIDWKWYEVMYGERYMETEATNPEGFAETSLISKASDLKGKLLICQGAIDKTVVWQHSLSFVQACIEEGVLLDYFPYPRSEHNVAGRWRVHLHDTITAYFDDNL